MPTSDELNALAERVERATGADREADVEIWRAICPQEYSIWECGVRGTFNRDWDEDRRLVTINANARIKAPRYTASLDAAMTLVPEGAWWVLKHWMGPSPSMADMFVADVLGRDDKSRPMQVGPLAATPALALTAAALRARAKAKDIDHAR